MEEYSIYLIYPINSIFTLYEKDYYYDSKLNKACRKTPLGFYTYKGKGNNTNQLLFEVQIMSSSKSKDIIYNATLWGPSFVGLLNRNDINLRKIPMDEELKCQINNYKKENVLTRCICRQKNIDENIEMKIRTYMGHMFHLKNIF